MVTVLQLGKAKAFALCFFQYMAIQNIRQVWSLASGRVAHSFGTADPLVAGFDDGFLGWINFLFLFSYGSFVLMQEVTMINRVGRLGDQMNPKTFLLLGMALTGAVFLLLGLLFKVEENHRIIILLLMVANGICQSSSWPGSVTIIDNWFPSKGKIILMGCFAACSNIGNLLGDLIFGLMVSEFKLPIYWPVIAAGIYMLFMVFVNLLLMKSRPDQDLEISKSAFFQESIRNQPIAEPIQITFVSVWFVPGVAIFAMAYGCVKSIQSTLGFWLPTYLDAQKNVSHVTDIVTMLDFGAIPGGILICLVGFYTGKRASVIVPALALGCLSMVGTSYLQHVAQPFIYYLVLTFLIGLFIGGVVNNIFAGITVELGRQFKNNKKAVSTVTAAIEGFGSIMAALNQLVIPHIGTFLFPYCALLALICGILLTPLLRDELFPTKKEIPQETDIKQSLNRDTQTSVVLKRLTLA